jgi:hypothetical protein
MLSIFLLEVRVLHQPVDLTEVAMEVLPMPVAEEELLM